MPRKTETLGEKLAERLYSKAERISGPKSGLPKSKFMPDVPRQVHAHGGKVKRGK